MITLKSVLIPFLDHLISDLSARFNDHVKEATTLEKLLPSKLDCNSSVADIQYAVSFYADDLTNSEIVDKELC